MIVKWSFIQSTNQLSTQSRKSNKQSNDSRVSNPPVYQSPSQSQNLEWLPERRECQHLYSRIFNNNSPIIIAGRLESSTAILPTSRNIRSPRLNLCTVQQGRRLQTVVVTWVSLFHTHHQIFLLLLSSLNFFQLLSS